MITESDLPRVYFICAYTDEVDATAYPVGSKLKELTTRGTITVSRNRIEYAFNPARNGGIGLLKAEFSQEVTEVDYLKTQFYCEEMGTILYESTLNDGRFVLIDECIEDRCWSYWVIEKIR